MEVVSMVTSLVVIFVVVATGEGAVTRRDVFPIPIPLNNKDMQPINETKNATEASSDPKTAEKSSKDEVKQAQESYPNPPVPTPEGFSLHQLFHKNKKDQQKSKTVHSDDVKATPTQWAFNDKYLASENRYAVKRNALFDGVGGDSMSFSNFQVLGNRDLVSAGKR